MNWAFGSGYGSETRVLKIASVIDNWKPPSCGNLQDRLQPQLLQVRQVLGLREAAPIDHTGHKGKIVGWRQGVNGIGAARAEGSSDLQRRA
jgi:hypothetical protein